MVAKQLQQIYLVLPDYSGRSSGALVSITDNEEIILNAIINCMKTYQDDVEELEKLAENGHMAQLIINQNIIKALNYL